MEKYILRREKLGFILYVKETNQIYFADSKILNIYDERNYTLLSHDKVETLPPDFFKHNVGRYIDGSHTEAIISAPETVFLEITKRCNLRCNHCFNDSGIKCTDELNFETICNLIDKLYDIGVFSIKVTGGEPFAKENILDILDYLEKKEMNFIVYSNGTCITPKHIERLSKLKHLQKIRISIDGNKKTNDAIRGNGTFEKAMKTARLLSNNQINCEINYTITKDNFYQIKEVSHYLQIHQIKCKINIGMVKMAGRAIKCEEEYYFVEDNIQEASENIKLQITNTNNIKPFHLLEPLYYKLFGKSFGCPAARLTMTVKSNGNVFPCGLFSEYHEFLCGNLSVEPFHNIWHSHAMNRVRHLTPSDKCSTCDFYKKNCTGACRGNALNYFGNISAEDINCYVYQVDFNEGRQCHE